MKTRLVFCLSQGRRREGAAFFAGIFYAVFMTLPGGAASSAPAPTLPSPERFLPLPGTLLPAVTGSWALPCLLFLAGAAAGGVACWTFHHRRREAELEGRVAERTRQLHDTEAAHQRAQAQLAFERDLLQALLDHLPDMIYFKDRQSRFIRGSRELAHRLGRQTVEEILGKTDFDFFAESHARPAFEDEREIMRTGQPLVGKRERETYPDRPDTWALTTKVPLRNRNGEIVGTFGISKDITAMVQAEAELQRAKESAEAATRAKSAFLASMSHEIRTPMNAIIGMANLLCETSLDAEQREYAETVRHSAESLLNLINDILDFSKIEAGKLTFETLDFDLREVIEETVELFADRCRQKQIEVGSFLPRNVPTRLRGDPGRLRQVLMNLVGNAVKFTEHGEVFVQVSCEEETETQAGLRVEVVDTGIGIAPTVQAEMFEPFTQADTSTTRRYGGTGLGLAISRQLITLMHGQIGLRSAPGQGATFWFTLRLDKQHNGVRPDPLPDDRRLANVRVLVVDDNATNRKILHHQLTSWGMREEAVASGPEALERLRQGLAEQDPFDLAILDMQMPDMDGLTLACALQTDPQLRSVRRLLLTSLGEKLSSERMQAGGISTCLIKPVRQSELFNSLMSMIAFDPLLAARKRTGLTTPLSPPDRKDLRVLVAEDNAVNQKLAVRQLAKLGYAADAVANGLEVIEALERIPYDIVLMDCQMPDMDGYEATRRIRRREKTGSLSPRLSRPVRIIALTADAMEADRQRCLEAGMDDYISKPVRIGTLKEALSRSEAAVTGQEGSDQRSDW